MNTSEKTIIIVKANITAPIEKVWKMWTDPTHIVHWNNASDDWHTPYAENDLKENGKFIFRMAAKDGSFEFDFNGTYNEIEINKEINYTIADGRKVKILFTPVDDTTKVSETFEAEETNPVEMQKGGWQAILNNFKKYVEN